MIFIKNRQSLEGATEARFCRVELLRAPFERVLPFQVFKLTITPEVSAHIRHNSLMVQNYDFNFFLPISIYSQTLRKYCIKTFPTTLILFFLKSPEKVGFLEKKVRGNPRRTAFCGSVPNCDSWEQVLENKKASFKALSGKV